MCGSVDCLMEVCVLDSFLDFYDSELILCKVIILGSFYVDYKLIIVINKVYLIFELR